MEHPIIAAVSRAGFTALGWFEPAPADGLAASVRFTILIGNAGPAMFRRFTGERIGGESLDEWTRRAVGGLAADLGATAAFPFDLPPLPFLTWARRAGAGHSSPLGLNIHPSFGLWHAYRAALFFPVAFDLPPVTAGPSPCDSCEARPCLTTCPVGAFNGRTYDDLGCGRHVLSAAGAACMTGGCRARLACPVGRAYTYEPHQMQFHMRAFAAARAPLLPEAAMDIVASTADNETG